MRMRNVLKLLPVAFVIVALALLLGSRVHGTAAHLAGGTVHAGAGASIKAAPRDEWYRDGQAAVAAAAPTTAQAVDAWYRDQQAATGSAAPATSLPIDRWWIDAANDSATR
jgi:hypothetical protein